MEILKPRKAINKAFLKLKPNRVEIERFKKNLNRLLKRINDTESEEFHKNLVSDFLKNTYYKDKHFINTKDRNDLVIHNESEAKSTVGVIIEAKKPTNKSEMLTKDKINVKAFQGLILYYLRERITHKNLEIKHLIATNISEWFIFDSNVFEKQFAQNKELVKQFKDFENGRLSGKTTDFFYYKIAKPFVNELKQEIEFTFFDIREYEKLLRNNNPKDDNKLISLFKLLSPEHLLKLPFANDSNSLDKGFYCELLHIIGLIETKNGGKKLIERNKKSKRNAGSFLENAIVELDIKINSLDNPDRFGATQEERLFSIGLELSITWINRILFLKLLEAQLKTYHKGDKSYEFLSIDKVKNYDDLNSLFFKVLAKRQSERDEDVAELFAKVPYLNSSLFEPAEIEQDAIFISNLRDDKTIPIYTSTVLKNELGKKRAGKLSTLEYLFEFLNAYDFSSEGKEEIQEDNKTLINASVLGLIFEKINGYKDGSFFTPGFITMYMCRETIRKAVIQKFNETKNWNCKDINSLYNKIEDRREANNIINSLKICDPAVGSGHFLVSALNEIIAVKNDLKILQDKDGKRLKEYQFEVVNDELIVTDEDGELFEYNPKSKESQRVQEALFHEKQNIIEGCLFGVDINSNSVKICRLRLWIELLKNAYYKNETELETLPNIDINIKCGNSLVSRFALNADLKKALKSSKWNIDSYRIAVSTYHKVKNKEQKREIQKRIDDIKNNFRNEISRNDPKFKKLKKLEGEIFIMNHQTKIFESTEKQKAARSEKLKKLTADFIKAESEIKEFESGKIYERAFEWRFEFPEVLDDDGSFVGFDVVVGNPPYVQLQSIKETSKQLQRFEFKTFSSTGDIYALFYEKGIDLLKPQGSINYITSNKWMRAKYGKSLRKFFVKYNPIQLIDLGADVFETATVDTNIIIVKKEDNQNHCSALDLSKEKHIADFEDYSDKWTTLNNLSDDSWIILSKAEQNIKQKIEAIGTPLKDWDIEINYGIKTGFNEAFIIDNSTKERLCLEDSKSAEILKPILRGRDIKRYKAEFAGLWVINSHNGLKSKGIKPIDINEYPAIKQHLDKYWDKISKRGDKGITPYNLRNCAYLENFEKENIGWKAVGRNLTFCLMYPGVYITAPSAFLTSNCNKFILAFLQSKLVKYYIYQNSDTTGAGDIMLNVQSFENIPIPKISIQSQKPFEDLVDQIIALKREGKDSGALEREIDFLVYELYELTEAEIGVVESVK